MKNIIEFGDVKFEISDINSQAGQGFSQSIPAMFYMFGDDDDTTKPEEASLRMYVLNGELEGNEWVLTTISNYGGDNLGGESFGFMRFHLHKLHQMRGLLDLKAIILENKSLRDLINEVWAKEMSKFSEARVFEKKYKEYIENPWII